MAWITDTKTIAAFFAIVGLIAAVLLMLRSDKKYATQLLGSLLVISISFSAHSAVVYTIAVFVIATLVTELQFLEKIAALIWNRKEYWNYLKDNASKEEIEAKAKSEVDADLNKNVMEGPDEVEAIEEITQEPEGIMVIEEIGERNDRQELVQSALQFEKTVFENLNSSQIPFPYTGFKKEVRIKSGAKSHVIDGIIETDGVHYLLEIKNIKRPSSLVNAVYQIHKYKSAYENYLNERSIKVAVQPLIIIPSKVNISDQFRGIPIVKYDLTDNAFSNIKAVYADFELSMFGKENENILSQLLLKFLRQYSKWAFSPLRIQKWGAKQTSYENISLYTTSEIRSELESLLNKGELEKRTSKKRNKLYRIKL